MKLPNNISEKTEYLNSTGALYYILCISHILNLLVVVSVKAFYPGTTGIKETYLFKANFL